MSQTTLKSVQVAAGKRTYFFDLTQNSDGYQYLKICESKRLDNNGFERNNILVPASELDKFSEGLQQVLAALPRENTTT